MKKLLVMLLVALVMFQGAAMANMVSGTVKSVNQTENKIEVANSSGESNWIWYGSDTKWSGVTSPAELQGKSVEIVATLDAATKNWKATSVSIAASQAPAASTTQAASEQAPAASAPAAAPAAKQAEM